MSMHSTGTAVVIGLVGGAVFLGAAAPASAREEITRFTPRDAPDGGQGFGFAVAMDGDYIVVGAPADGDQVQSSGAAYVFKREGMNWVEQTKLIAHQAGFNDVFGAAVAIDGDLIVVGAPHEDPAGSDFGFAVVYRREGSAWVEESTLVSSGSARSDFFGTSVSISGNLVVVGAPGENVYSGAAYVFRREGTTWVEEARLAPGDLAEEDTFGHSVSIAGDLAVVGSLGDDDAGLSAGAAYVFRRQGLSWVEEYKLVATEFDGIARVGKVDVDDNKSLAQRYAIGSIPSLLFFRNGEVVDRVQGVVPKSELTGKLTALSAITSIEN